MNIRSAWSDYWFKDAPYFDLCFLRIIVVGLQCYLMLSQVFGGLVYVIGLDNALYEPLTLVKIFMLPWGWGARPDGEWMIVAFWLTLAFGALSFVGLMTNVSLMLFTLGNLFLQAYNYSFRDFHHPQAVMMIALLALALSPCGKVLSVDSAFRNLRSFGMPPASSLLEYRGPHAGWPVKLIQWFFPLMYLSAFLGKFGKGGLDWANGYTLQYYMVHDALRQGGDMALALWLSSHHDLIVVAQALILIFQATFFLVLPFPKLRWIYLPVGLLFHLSNYWILRAPFPQWIALYAVFIPWSEVVKYLAAARVVPDRAEVRHG